MWESVLTQRSFFHNKLPGREIPLEQELFAWTCVVIVGVERPGESPRESGRVIYYRLWDRVVAAILSVRESRDETSVENCSDGERTALRRDLAAEIGTPARAVLRRPAAQLLDSPATVHNPEWRPGKLEGSSADEIHGPVLRIATSLQCGRCSQSDRNQRAALSTPLDGAE